MARSFVLGGPSATNIATGVPYIRRIVRRGSASSAVNRKDEFVAIIGGHPALDKDGDGVKEIPIYNDGSVYSFNGTYTFSDGVASQFNASTFSKAWNLNYAVFGGVQWLAPYTFPGEMLYVQLPATSKTFSVHFEAANYGKEHLSTGIPMPEGPENREHRLKVMLTAPGQKVTQLDAYGNPALDADGNEIHEFMDPINNKNYIEIVEGQTATFNARTNHFFIFLTTYDTNNIFDDALSGELEDVDSQRGLDDAVSILVTAILEHEGDGLGTETKVIGSDGQERQPIRKIYPQSTKNTSGIG